jgi:hypothetical protein
MRSQHIWTNRDGEGRKREVRATKFGGKWRFQAKYGDELDWTYYEQPLLEDLQTLKDVVFRKYQRRRASAEDVASVEELLRQRATDSTGNNRIST